MPPLPQISKNFQERDNFGVNSVFSGWKSDANKPSGWGDHKKMNNVVDEPIDTWGNQNSRQKVDSSQSGGSLFDMSFGAASNGNVGDSASVFNTGSIFDRK